MKINIKQHSHNSSCADNSPVASKRELYAYDAVRQQRFLEAEFRHFTRRHILYVVA